jgi:hypothetical protein
MVGQPLARMHPGSCEPLAGSRGQGTSTSSNVVRGERRGRRTILNLVVLLVFLLCVAHVALADGKAGEGNGKAGNKATKDAEEDDEDDSQPFVEPPEEFPGWVPFLPCIHLPSTGWWALGRDQTQALSARYGN